MTDRRACNQCGEPCDGHYLYICVACAAELVDEDTADESECDDGWDEPTEQPPCSSYYERGAA